MYNFRIITIRIFLVIGLIVPLLGQYTPVTAQEESLHDTLQTAAESTRSAVFCALNITKHITGIRDQSLQGCLVEQSTAITLTPIELSDFGITSIIPDGWQLTSPGTYSSPTGTALLQQAIPNFTVDQFVMALLEPFGVQEPPAPTGTLESDWATWQHYTFEVDNLSQIVAMQLAIVEVESTTYAIMLAAAPEEIGPLYTTVFLPAVATFRPTTP